MCYVGVAQGVVYLFVKYERIRKQDSPLPSRQLLCGVWFWFAAQLTAEKDQQKFK